MNNRLRNVDWDAIAGIVAAVVALSLHLLHIVEADVLLAIAVVILALLLLRDLRRESREDAEADTLARMERALNEVRADVQRQDVHLLGPPDLRRASAQFGQQTVGEAIWFNVCLSMFIPQRLFDTLLRPMVENPDVQSIQFILDRREQETWASEVIPKLEECAGREKVAEPIWRDIDESVSCILAENRASGGVEALLSFWGEPFMARRSGQDVPRYIFLVLPHSELIQRLRELERSYRLPNSSPPSSA